MQIQQQTGLSIHVHDPLVIGGKFLKDISAFIESYSHELGADGGCVSATMQINTNHLDMQDWFANGLGRNIRVYNPASVLIWQGFVNLLTVAVGALAGESRGPLMDIGNRVSAVYSPIDVSVYPPVVGSTTITTIAENTDSQALYGIIEKVISSGTCVVDDANYARSLYLTERAYPVTSGEVNPDANSVISVSLECLGYDAWLDAYVYNNLNSGFTTLGNKITAVLSADPNGFISTDLNGVDTNALLTYAAENQNRFARTIINEIVPIGDINNARWLFGIDQDRKAYFKAAPTAIDYTLQLSDGRQRIMAYGSEVYPWDVKPGKWIKVSDFMTGSRVATNAPYTTDVSRKFIDSVRYTAPWAVSLTSGTSGTLAQLLAKLGGSA